MADQTLTLTLPESVYKTLSDRAARRNRTVESEAAEYLGTAPPEAGPFAEDLTGEIESILAGMIGLTDEELRRVLADSTSQAGQDRLADLSWEASRRPLSGEELAERRRLATESDRKMLIRAQALAILRQRGEDVTGLLTIR